MTDAPAARATTDGCIAVRVSPGDIIHVLDPDKAERFANDILLAARNARQIADGKRAAGLGVIA